MEERAPRTACCIVEGQWLPVGIAGPIQETGLHGLVHVSDSGGAFQPPAHTLLGDAVEAAELTPPVTVR